MALLKIEANPQDGCKTAAFSATLSTDSSSPAEYVLLHIFQLTYIQAIKLVLRVRFATS